MSFNIIAEQTGILVFFMLVGYVLAKSRIVECESASAALSKLEFYVFAPALTFKSFISNVTPDALFSKDSLLVLGCVTVIATYMMSKLIALLFSKKRYERGIISYAFTVPNYGYMGYALMLALFGEKMLFSMMVFAIPLSIFTYSEGYRILSEQQGFSLRKIVNPSIIAIILGSIAGLFFHDGISFVNPIINPAAQCMAPVAMLLTGITVAEFNLKKTFLNARSYIIVVLKLLIIPVLMLYVLKMFNVNKVVITVIMMIYAMPVGMNTIIFPKLRNEDCRLGVSLVTISNILSIVTIPLILFLIY